MIKTNNKKQKNQIQNINWNIKIKDIKDFPQLANKDINNKIKIFSKIKLNDRNWDNTILAIETMIEKWDDFYLKISSFSLCHPDKNIREAVRVAEEKYSEILNKLSMNEIIYKGVMDYVNNNFQKDLSENKLDNQDIKLVQDMLISFKHSGIHLAKEKREKLLKIRNEINVLAIKYDKNINESTPFIICNKDELSGLSENIINGLEKINNIKGEIQYKVSISYPEYGPFMRYVENRDKRKELYLLFNNHGGKENVKLLSDILKLRKEQSKILGYKNHVDYMTENRLAKNTANVEKMSDDLLVKLEKLAKKDINNLKKVAKSLGINDYKSYDQAFVMNYDMKKRFNYDENILREYFPLENVFADMFQLFGKLFNIKFEKINIKTWHKDVFVYNLIDKKSNDTIAQLYMDLFPREGKYGHACMHTIKVGNNYDVNNTKLPVSLLVCNFSKPQKNTPSLLNMGEIETLYHEAGHGIHSLLSKAKYSSHFGCNVAWDFVETPSQIMEMWLVEEKYLNKIGKHYKTGKSLPKSIIETILNVNKQYKSLFYTRQLIQGKLDIELHKYSVTDSVKYFNQLVNKYLIENDTEILFTSRFAHIVRGYDAGYYSYLFAEIIARDMFSIFQENGLWDNKTGMKYRKEILEAGSSRDENDSIEAFLGRKYDDKAFVKTLK